GSTAVFIAGKSQNHSKLSPARLNFRASALGIHTPASPAFRSHVKPAVTWLPSEKRGSKLKIA
ncbi:hypothetical protein ACFQY0_21070, partial [Haloferula chungangensis]